MPRPRKDGKATRSAIRVGKARFTDMGREWRVRAYAPTPSARSGRVTIIVPGSEKLTSRAPKVGETLDDCFDRLERAFDAKVSVQVARKSGGSKDIEALCEMYVASLQKRKLDEDTIINRECIIRVHIVPIIGDVPICDWAPDHSSEVIETAQGKVGAARVEDIGTVLAGLRRVAHAKRTGGRLLDPNENPLEGVSYSKRSSTGRVKAVPLNMRPSRKRVRRAIKSARQIGRWEWLGDAIEVAAANAPRQSELLGLRAVDVDFDGMQLDFNGRWKTQRRADVKGGPRRRYRMAHLKNGLEHRLTPFYGSETSMLARRCAIALGLPADTSVPVVAKAVREERARRAEESGTGDWRDYVPTDPHDELWLFPADDGLPPSKESFNDAWHEVRDDSGWTKSIPFMNLRHYAILRWYNLRDEDGNRLFDFQDIAPWSGHSHETLRKYYVLPNEDVDKKANKHFRNL